MSSPRFLKTVATLCTIQRIDQETTFYFIGLTFFIELGQVILILELGLTLSIWNYQLVSSCLDNHTSFGFSLLFCKKPFQLEGHSLGTAVPPVVVFWKKERFGSLTTSPFLYTNLVQELGWQWLYLSQSTKSFLCFLPITWFLLKQLDNRASRDGCYLFSAHFLIDSLKKLL